MLGLAALPLLLVAFRAPLRDWLARTSLGAALLATLPLVVVAGLSYYALHTRPVRVSRPSRAEQEFERADLDRKGFAAMKLAAAEHHSRTRAAITDVIDAEAFGIALQPIIDVSDDRTVGYEALARFTTDLYPSPDLWFMAAREVGVGTELELSVLRAALRFGDRLPAGVYLSVNLSPTALLAPQLADTLAETAVPELVIELTEHLAVDDYLDYSAIITALRSVGVRIAIDDTGAGHSSLRHVLNLAPELVKLDRDLINNVHADPSRRSLVTALVTFCRDVGMQLVAEGVEQEADLEVLRALGVRFAQGYLLGRPKMATDMLELQNGSKR